MTRHHSRIKTVSRSPQQGAALSVKGVFAAAVQRHQAGCLTDAVLLYGRVLAVDGRHADSLHLLGVAAHQMGRDELAVAMIGEAIANNANVASYHCSLGNALTAQRHFDEAVVCYRRALSINPGDVEAHNNLGIALAAQGQLEEAAACYRQAIAAQPTRAEAHYNLGNALKGLVTSQGPDVLEEAAKCYMTALRHKPDYAEAHYNLGLLLQERGKLDEAAISYRKTVELRPGDPNARNNLANVLKEQGRLNEAITCYRETIAVRPDFPEAYNNLGNALREQGCIDEAAIFCRRALELRPNFAEAHYNLGIVLGDQVLGDGTSDDILRLDRTAACFRAAIDIKPDYAEAHNNLGLVLKDQRRLDEAVTCFRIAISLKPDFAEAHNNLGITLGEMGRLEEAVSSYRTAIVYKPGSPEMHKNLGMALLAQGDLEAGWEEYEWRWKTLQMTKTCREFKQPQWRGELGSGRTLLIHAEQGYGDTLQFCRFAPLAAAHGLRIILEVQGPLVRLLRSLSRQDSVGLCGDAGIALVTARGSDLPQFDLHCPMLSIPLALGTVLETIPSASSYLRADAAQISTWHVRLSDIEKERGRDRRTLRVGLVWAGSPRSHIPAMAAVDRRRSLAPGRLSPLFEIPGVTLFSLQKGGAAMSAGVPLVDLTDELVDFADTAALISNLDLVVSVDTAVAHLAAALGKPVWMLERFDSCWRWLSGRRESPWYPSLRLYRQPRPGDWDAVLAEVTNDLASVVASNAVQN